jgi:probable FeS assembly SUF system protein SufT
MYQPSGDPVAFKRDCDAVLVPGGDSGVIPQGAQGVVTQALGGSFTIYIQGNLFRIAGEDADAIGLQPIEPPQLPERATDHDVEQVIWQQLHTCFDPEIPVDIVELGLVYRCELKPLAGGGRRVEIDMTLTAPGCGMGEVIADDVRGKVLLVPTVNEAVVEVVFDPPWQREMMSEAARLQTGMM